MQGRRPLHSKGQEGAGLWKQPSPIFPRKKPERGWTGSSKPSPAPLLVPVLSNLFELDGVVLLRRLLGRETVDHL